MRTRASTFELALSPLALAVVAAFSFSLPSAGCSSSPDDESLTPAEWLDRNTPLLENLRSYEVEKRHRAIAVFKELGKERGTAIALSLLFDPTFEDYRIKVVLARILADWQDRRAIPYLLEALRSPDAGAVLIAKEGLEVFRDDPRLIDVVAERLGDAGVVERRVAADLLSRIGSERVADLFIQHYRDEADAEVRAYYLLGVIASRHPRRTRFLIDALTDPDDALRKLAWNALDRTSELPEDVTFDPLAPDRDRADAVADLRIWWDRSHGAGGAPKLE